MHCVQINAAKQGIILGGNKSMKTTFISKENNEVRFEMEFNGEEFEDAIIKVYKENKDKFQVDGFRKGKAPRSIIEKKYGEHIFEDDAVNDLFASGYVEAIAELGLEVINSPRAEFKDIKRDEGFKVTVTVEVYPVVDVHDYKGVEIEKVDGEVHDEDVDEAVRSLQKRNARMENVDRAVQRGDHIIFDFEGFIDGEAFEGGKAERYSLEVGSDTFIPGFEDQLVGLMADDEKDVEVTFPEDYQAEELAGKDAVFKCKVHEIKEEQLPELDDDFAKDVSEFDTLEELKKNETEKLVKSKKERAENMMKDAALKAVYDANDIEVPEILVKEEIDNTITQMKQKLMQQGVEWDTYLGYIKKEESAIRQDQQEAAGRTVKTRMLVAAVVEKEKIKASDEDLEKQIKDMADQYGVEPDKIREMIGEENMHYIMKDIEMQKAVQFVYDNAVVKDSTAKPE